MTIFIKQNIHGGDLEDGYNVAAEKKKKKQFYKSTLLKVDCYKFCLNGARFLNHLEKTPWSMGISGWVTHKCSNSSEANHYSPDGRLLSLELDNVSSSGMTLSSAVVFIRLDVVGCFMRGAFVFVGSGSVLSQARLLAFFSL